MAEPKTAKLIRLLANVAWVAHDDSTTRPSEQGGPYLTGELPAKVKRWKTAVLKPDCVELLTGDDPPVVTTIRTPYALAAFRDVLRNSAEPEQTPEVDEAIADLEK